MMKNTLLLCILIVAALGLGACSNAKKKLGLEKPAPDEFAVVKRAPLQMPPEYALRPPQPGAPRPQEAEPSQQAKESVLGVPAQAQTQIPASNPEAALLQQAGVQQADPAIRAKVDAETAEDVDDKRPVAQKLLNIMSSEQTPSASVVNPSKEAERIQTNKQSGKPITEGDTPAVVR